MTVADKLLEEDSKDQNKQTNKNPTLKQNKTLDAEEKHFLQKKIIQERNMKMKKGMKTNGMGKYVNKYIIIPTHSYLLGLKKYIEIKCKINSIVTIKRIILVKQCKK